MLLHIGQAGFSGEIARYLRAFDLLELSADPGRLPRLARLKSLAQEAPPGFVFSVKLPKSVTRVEPGPDAERELAHALKAADVLGAHWLVVQTPPAATPGRRTRRRLDELSERLGDARRIAWEPRGLWQENESAEVADALGWHLVRDLSRSPPPDEAVVYTRLLALGESSRVRTRDLERLAEHLESAESAYVVMEGRGAAGAARVLRELVGLDGASDEDEGLAFEPSTEG